MQMESATVGPLQKRAADYQALVPPVIRGYQRSELCTPQYLIDDIEDLRTVALFIALFLFLFFQNCRAKSTEKFTTVP